MLSQLGQVIETWQVKEGTLLSTYLTKLHPDLRVRTLTQTQVDRLDFQVYDQRLPDLTLDLTCHFRWHKYALSLIPSFQLRWSGAPYNFDAVSWCERIKQSEALSTWFKHLTNGNLTPTSLKRLRQASPYEDQLKLQDGERTWGLWETFLIQFATQDEVQAILVKDLGITVRKWWSDSVGCVLHLTLSDEVKLSDRPEDSWVVFVNLVERRLTPPNTTQARQWARYLVDQHPHLKHSLPRAMRLALAGEMRVNLGELLPSVLDELRLEFPGWELRAELNQVSLSHPQHGQLSYRVHYTSKPANGGPHFRGITLALVNHTGEVPPSRTRSYETLMIPEELRAVVKHGLKVILNELSRRR